MHMISPKIRCVPYHIARGKLLHLGFHFWKHRLKTFGLIYEEKRVLSTKCTAGLKWWGLQFWVVHNNIRLQISVVFIYRYSTFLEIFCILYFIQTTIRKVCSLTEPLFLFGCLHLETHNRVNQEQLPIFLPSCPK